MARDINSTGWQRKSITDFYKSVAESSKNNTFQKYMNKITTMSESEVFEWLGDFPGMVLKKGDRIVKAMLKHQYTLAVDEYESTLGFKKKKFETSPDFYKSRVTQLAASLVNHPASLMFTNLVANNLSYDGQPFFDTSHIFLNSLDREATYSNLITGSGILEANIKTDFTTGRKNLRDLKQRNGDPLFDTLGEITITCSSALETIMDTVFNQPNDGNNAFYKKATVEVSGHLTGNDWYMSLLTKPMKPFIFLERKKLTAEWNLELIKTNSKLYFQADSDYAVGNGFPQLMQKVDN